eukprot:8405484-Lingulodinium_polyedra.AAC.1
MGEWGPRGVSVTLIFANSNTAPFSTATPSSTARLGCCSPCSTAIIVKRRNGSHTALNPRNDPHAFRGLMAIS